MNVLYGIGKNLCAGACKLWGHWQVIGADNVPKTGGVLLCGNHISYMDPPALGAGCRRQVHFMAKEPLFRVPVLGYLIRKVGAFPVHQNSADRAALKTAIEYLKAGEVVGMFPEGRRRFDGKLGKPLPGAAMIVLRAGVPVVPVALIGTDKLLPPHSSTLKSSRIKVAYGKPITFDDLKDLPGREPMDAAGERIMSAIGELIEEHK
ncbi:MAG: 1-acyl-sn-glycerol-3-phosphate acyltransferase [Abditibacteriota bacterium]|nr:1-acyl-sn-glycerol-3-phosphate acyltransferase [Abditibacteriota bacterium]